MPRYDCRIDVIYFLETRYKNGWLYESRLQNRNGFDIVIIINTQKANEMIPSVVINSGFKGFVNLYRAVVYNYITI